MNDSADVTHKRSDCIPYFHKLMYNFAYIQTEIQCNVFNNIYYSGELNVTFIILEN